MLGQACQPGIRWRADQSHLVFAGQALDGSDAYGCQPGSNLGLYTLNSDNHGEFAAGFDLVAAEVARLTGGVQVGFFIDAVPSQFNASFRASASATGPHLRNTAAFLGIQCFIPEIFTAITGDANLLAWKRTFLRDWLAAGIPVVADVSPGYDAHLVFPGASDCLL